MNKGRFAAAPSRLFALSQAGRSCTALVFGPSCLLWLCSCARLPCTLLRAEHYARVADRYLEVSRSLACCCLFQFGADPMGHRTAPVGVPAACAQQPLLLSAVL